MMECSAAIEQIANHLAGAGNLQFQPRHKLAEKINVLKGMGLIEEVTASHMHAVRVLRNSAAHGESVLDEDAKVSRVALNAVVTRAFADAKIGG